MGSYIPDLPRLYIETPCIPSRELSRAAGCNIYLKLENLQPSGSFKSRGIGTLMLRAVQASTRGRVHFYSSSGGNAGLACAEAAQTLGQPCDVFVTTMTPENVVCKLAQLGATAHRAGSSWPEADAHCREVVAADPEAVYVPPFDHPDIWDGAATLIDEIAALEGQGYFGARGVDAVVCNVGGGGLLNGVMEGIERNYHTRLMDTGMDMSSLGGRRRHSPAVLAIETKGADSLAECIRRGAHVAIPAITSVATTLGAPLVSAQTYRWAQRCGATTLASPAVFPPVPTMERPERPPLVEGRDWIMDGNGVKKDRRHLVSAVVSDAEAVAACARFLGDARILVEVACGATLASAYISGLLRHALGGTENDESWAKMNVVLVVCGGSGISMDMLAQYRATFKV